ncbi:hypothetical protein IWW50_001733 [Coemansia erecta]|nr:hypothetical protein IWW50_001733 [Coemansia erecta]
MPPKPVSVVWNRPRHRINWTSLSNALYHDLIGSLTGEVAAPVTARAKRDVQTADTLAGDITQSIVDYTSAFVAYEESYRCLLFAQADAFRARTLRRRALAQWSMETVARLQDRALQQRYLDDLDDIIDSEYSSRPQTYMGDDDDVLGVTRAPAAPNPDTIAPRAAPEGFWDSLHMGAECFGTVSRALTRFGNPVFQAVVDVDGAQSTAVLSSWLWWQLDPASIERSDAGSRAASYGSDEQRLLFRDQVDERCVQNGDTAALAAQLVVLAAEPIGAADIRTPAAAVEGGLASTIVARVGRALDRARAVQPASGVHPLLFVFWSSGDTKAVRRLIERAASASGTPSFVAVNILALTVDSSKQQLSTGLKWICRHLLQTRKAALVKVARAYAPIVGALLQALQRICGCVRALANSEQPDAGTQTAVFNLAVDTVNAFLVLLNESLFRGAEGLRAGLYQHASEHEGLGRGYFDASGPSGSLPLDLNAVVAAMVDDILASDSHVYGHVSLGSCLRALEFVVKHQLDELQHAVPRSVYVDRRAITEATQATMRAAEQRLRQAAQLCQTNTMDWSPFVTPTAKRPSSLAFNGSPPSLDLGSVASTRDSAAMSVSTVSTPATSKRHRLTDSAQQLSRLQSAMARASKHLLD